MNNQVALSIFEAITSVECNTIIVTIVTNNGSVYTNVEVDDFNTKGVYFSNDRYTCYVAYNKIVEINVRNVPE